MWSNLRKQIAIELTQLQRLYETHRPLIEKCKTVEPSEIEVSALGAFLQAYYNGVENIFKRISVEIDGQLPKSEEWHRALLDSMLQATELRGRVISRAFHRRLREYLKFRHLFRQAYPFQLRWPKMAPLVFDCPNSLRLLQYSLRKFLKSGSR